MPASLSGWAKPSRAVKTRPSRLLGRRSGVAEHVRHEVRAAIGHGLDAESPLAGLEREGVAGQRRRDDGEGVGWVAAEAGRVGQARDQLEELEHGAGPAVREQQRQGGRPLARRVNEVQVDALQRHLVLREGVEPRLLRAPVEAVRQ